MQERPRLMAVLAHPDDEAFAVGGALARSAMAGVETYVVTATRGERGRFFDDARRPDDATVGSVREAELRAAARVLGVRDVAILGYLDGELDRADPARVVARIVAELRRVRPHVVVTFDPFGLYGHPDHVAICQLTTAAVAAAADPSYGGRGATPHRVAKLYYTAWTEPAWDAFRAAFRPLVSRVDDVARSATAWPAWAVSARLDTRAVWETVWRAVRCHRTQLAIYRRLDALTPDRHRELWGAQTFYRAQSLVNGGRAVESDLFEGLFVPAGLTVTGVHRALAAVAA